MYRRQAALMLALIVLCGMCSAYGDFAWSAVDLLPNTWPDGVPNHRNYAFPTEVFRASAGYQEATGLVTVTINTKFPETGTGSRLSDSYQSGKNLLPGDLFVSYAPAGNIWQPEELFAIGVSDHSGNVVGQAYDDDENWGTILRGRIYSTPTGTITDWATGTEENYDAILPGRIPQDADDLGITVVENGLVARTRDTEMIDGEYLVNNTYPTLLKAPLADLGAATVQWALNPGYNFANRIGPYDLTIQFDPGYLGLDPSQFSDLKFFWTMECGNDGVLLAAPAAEAVPEPLSVVLLGTVAAGALLSRRNRRRVCCVGGQSSDGGMI